MIMTEELEGRMQNVCSWSEYFIEEGLKEGREEGISATAVCLCARCC